MFAELRAAEKPVRQSDVSDPDWADCQYELHRFDCGLVNRLDNDDEHKEFQDFGSQSVCCGHFGR